MDSEVRPNNGDVVKSKKTDSKGVVFAVDPEHDLVSVRDINTNEVHCSSIEQFNHAWEPIVKEAPAQVPARKSNHLIGCLWIIVFVVLGLSMWGIIGFVKFMEGPKLTPAEEAGDKARIGCIDRMNAHAIATYQDMPSMNELGRACDPEYMRAYNAVLNPPQTKPASTPDPVTLPNIPPTAKELAEWSSTLHYKVLKLKRDQYVNCDEDVQLPHETDDAELTQISEAIKQHECRGLFEISLKFYLPGMKVGEGAWANAQYEPNASNPNPTFTVKITGMKPEEAAAFRAYKVKPGEILIGSWVDRSDGFVYTILRKGDKYFETLDIKKQTDTSNDALSYDELKEVDSSSGRKFIVVGTGDYDVVAPDGSLREYDRDGFIKKLPKL